LSGSLAAPITIMTATTTPISTTRIAIEEPLSE
jgi:hypothetical protein